MVNTFLTSPSFAESASWLDQARLGKQRVESKQILDLVMKYYFLGKAFGNPVPSDPYLLYDWTRVILQQFNRSGYSLIARPGVTGTPKSEDDYALAPANSVPEGSIIFKMGFANHPCVLQWINWPDALREYIDVHIAEWVRRGFVNNMTRYSVRGAPRPPWTYDADFIRRHRSMLLQKEQQRNEAPWYVNNPVFMAENTLPSLKIEDSGTPSLKIEDSGTPSLKIEDSGTPSTTNVQPVKPKIYFWPFTLKTSAGDCDAEKRYTRTYSMMFVCQK